MENKTQNYKKKTKKLKKKIFILSKSCESKKGALRQHRGSHCKKQVWPLGLEEQREKNLEAPKKEPRSWDSDLWGHCLPAAAFSEGVPGGWSASEGKQQKTKREHKAGTNCQSCGEEPLLRCSWQDQQANRREQGLLSPPASYSPPGALYWQSPSGKGRCILESPSLRITDQHRRVGLGLRH